tara:strand:+ start:89 stop:859 length:771 start_codon:yes stop_codon:yes gene_type:complete
MVKLLAVLMFMLSLSAVSFADDHSGDTPLSPLALQVNMCELNEGFEEDDLSRLDQRYLAWAEENDVQRTFVRQTPLMFPRALERPTYFDFHLGSHELTGQVWKKWLRSEDGRKLNAEWQKIATCRVVMTTLFRRYAEGEPQAGDQRVVRINWCNKNEGKTWDQLRERHDRAAQSGGPSNGEAVFWGLIVPRVGGQDLPGDFAHVMTFNDMERFMAYQRWFDLEGGSASYGDYNSSYATCLGPSIFVEDVIHMTPDL